MDLINQVKDIISERKRMNPQVFNRIKENKEIMRVIDILKGKYRFQEEDWDYDCAWYELYKLADLEIKDDVFSLAMERIKDVETLSNFYHCLEGKHSEEACRKGLVLAKSSNDFKYIARQSSCQETVEKAIERATALAVSSEDCCSVIGVMRDDLENSDIILKQVVGKGVALAKNLHNDIYTLRRFMQWYGEPPRREELRRDLVLAQNLLDSKLRFEHKRQLRDQVDLYKRRGDEGLSALEALLTSIIMFDEYKYLCTIVPKGQKRLS